MNSTAEVGQEHWKKKSTSKHYDLMEYITNASARALISQSKFPTSSSKSVSVFDNACGTGIVTLILFSPPYENVQKVVEGGDISSYMLKIYNKRAQDHGWTQVQGTIKDAMNTGFPGNYFDYIFTSSALFAFPDPIQSLKESIRISKPGGTIGFTTWKHTSWLDVVDLAVTRVGAPKLADIRNIFRKTGDWDSPDFISHTLQTLGFQNIKVESLDTILEIEDIENWVEKHWASMGPVLMMPWSNEEREVWKGKVKKEYLTILGEEREAGKGKWELKMFSIIATATKAED